jgi:hypothetical protein
MLLPFDDRLRITKKFDPETVLLADRHYSRQKPGTPQFLPPGRTLVIRDTAGLILFAWLHQKYRDDNEQGYNCAIFRNESSRLSSQIILECEQLCVDEWGASRAFTYIDPKKVQSPNPGYCFKVAGWKYSLTKMDGKHLLTKELK